MIVDVGLSPFAPLDLSASKRLFAAESLLRTFFDALFAHGTVVMASAGDFELLAEVVRDSALTQDEKTRWQAALVHLRKQNRIRIATPGLADSLDELHSVSDFLRLKGGLPLVGVVAEDAFVRLFSDNKKGIESISPDVSLATGPSASEAGPITVVRDIAEKKKYLKGSSREQVWTDLFHRAASVSSHVAICDRYLLKQLMARDAAGTRGGDLEHVMWLLSKVDEFAQPGTRVIIHTEIGRNGSPASAAAATALITRQWTPTGGHVHSVEVIGAPWWQRRTHPHNRHVRFGTNYGFKLDEGLDRLDSAEIDSESGFAFTYRWRQTDIREMRREEQLVVNATGSQRSTTTFRV